MIDFDEDALLRSADRLRHRAYAPYSGFHVGAVIVTRDGRHFDGVNVENASYGLSRCAEQSAVQAMATAGDRSDIVVVAVVGDGDNPCTPCGACRQILFEFGPDARVFARGASGPVLSRHIRELLPDAFGPQRLAAEAATSTATPPGTPPVGAPREAGRASEVP